MDASKSYPDAENWVNAWFHVAQKATWARLADVRSVYPATDQVGQCLVFDVRGNNYRLIATVVWARSGVGAPAKTVNGTLYIKHFLTHAEYHRDAWKGCCYPP
jgi:mRNA interferase HigB